MDRMAREIEKAEADSLSDDIDQDLERVDWWVDTVRSLAQPIPDYETLRAPQVMTRPITPASA